MPTPAPAVETIQKLMHSALHPSTTLSVRKSTLRKILRSFKTVDVLDFEIIERKPLNQIRHGASASSTTKGGSLSGAFAGLENSIDAFKKGAERLREENDTIRAQNRAQAERIAELEAKIAELESAQAAPAAVSDTGKEYVPWVEFEASAVQAFGREAGWKSVAAFEMDMDIKTLNAWQVVGVIPAKYVAVVKALTDDQKAPASRKKWADADYDRLKALVDEGHRDREIAKILSREFGRRLVETSITGARRRLFRGR